MNVHFVLHAWALYSFAHMSINWCRLKSVAHPQKKKVTSLRIPDRFLYPAQTFNLFTLVKHAWVGTSIGPEEVGKTVFLICMNIIFPDFFPWGRLCLRHSSSRLFHTRNDVIPSDWRIALCVAMAWPTGTERMKSLSPDATLLFVYSRRQSYATFADHWNTGQKCLLWSGMSHSDCRRLVQ
jgi:hypothetical protein